MREILFRGKTLCGKWVEGLPYEVDGVIDCIRVKEQILDIISYTTYKVIPESISEFTGLTDKNGNKIFEGNIVDYDYFGERKIGKIFFNNCGYEIENEGCFLCVHYTDKQLDCEVIGNIHDNPELLKGGGTDCRLSSCKRCNRRYRKGR